MHRKGNGMVRQKIRKILSLSLAVTVLWSLARATAFADTYNVNAVVPYEAPTQMAVISSPSDNTVVYDAQQTISGTCQLQNPHAVVSIWKAQTIMGSSECSDGTFSVIIVLHLGENNLIARTTNANGIYGPDSVKTKIQLKNPIKADPLPVNINKPVSVQDHEEAINQGGIVGLLLTTETPFEVLPTSKQAKVKVVVGGGQQPYVLQLKWGDGSTESHSITEPGTYEFAHTYIVHKTYGVLVAVRDVLGAYTEYMYAVISGVKSPSTTSANGGKTSTTTQQSEPWRFVGIVWYCWIFIIFAVVFLLSSYVLGYRKGRERSQIELEQKALAAKKKKRKPKKK